MNENVNVDNYFIARHVRFDDAEDSSMNTILCVPCTVSEDAKQCSICLQEHDTSDYVFIHCNAKHVYGKNCIQSWLTYNKTCPMCREVLNNEEFISRIMLRGKCSREIAVFIHKTYGKYVNNNYLMH